MKTYEITVGIADELLFLRVPNAINEDDALQQVYDSNQVSWYESEDIENLEVIEIIEELEE